MKIGLLLYTYSESEREKFGIDVFAKKSIDVKILDCSMFFFNKKNNNSHVGIVDRYNFEQVLLQENFDYLLVNFPFTFKTISFYRLLWKRKIPFCVFFLDSWPHGLCLSPYYVLKRFIKNIFFFFVMIFFPKIEKIFTPVKFYPETQYMLWRSKDVIAYRSLDYDSFLRQKKMLKSDKRSKDYVLFLDQFWPFHPDFRALDKVIPLAEDYYRDHLEVLFSFIEKTLGKRIVIALHPKAEIDLAKQIYGKRELIKNETLNLISGASFVLGHYSTSLIFALALKKPIGLIGFDQLSKKHSFYIKNLVTHFDFPYLVLGNNSEERMRFFFNELQKQKNETLNIQKYIAEDTESQKSYWENLIEKIFP